MLDRRSVTARHPLRARRQYNAVKLYELVRQLHLDKVYGTYGIRDSRQLGCANVTFPLDFLTENIAPFSGLHSFCQEFADTSVIRIVFGRSTRPS